MDFTYSPKSLDVQDRVRRFIDAHVAPRVRDWDEAVHHGRFPPPFMEDLKARAKAEGLWNLFLPGLRDDEPGTRLSNLDYAPVAEILGRIMWSSEVFNCNAPDTGNMELLHMFANPQQYDEWLRPLLEGKIRSAFVMTEPAVASSDATNIQTRIERVGDHYVINGRKWFITNASDPRCRISILMGVTNPEAETHRRQSMILIPMDTPGVTVVRNPPVMNHIAPEGHCEVLYENVKVPVANLLGSEGQGFEMAQARLGPGRIHHCMRSIGQCELALDLMMQRAQERRTFGRALAEHGTVMEWIALSRAEIEQARLLVLRTAWLMDAKGNKAARKDVSLIKVVVPRMQTTIANRAIQAFGAKGLTNDTPLANIWSWGRALQIVDGPDEVHLRTIARIEIKEQKARLGNRRLDDFSGLPTG
ncbi:MAG: acyl-CoA dehydrogenase family protein [Alphaproteobacteria bacterium]|nr:acyl-CoA dehydrogenase family protein [Alphaproteobacteria bacterium]